MTLFNLSEQSDDGGSGAGKPRILIVETDGGSRGNPGHAGYGALVRDPASGRIIAERAEYLGKVSNNVAEYSGLVAGLQLALDTDAEALIHVKMDSKLVVEQMSGRWKIKHEDMRALATKARAVVNPQRVRYEWIPRESNKDADRLSNEAMDAGEAGVDWRPAAGSVSAGAGASGAASGKPDAASGKPDAAANNGMDPEISPEPRTSPMPLIVQRDLEPYVEPYVQPPIQPYGDAPPAPKHEPFAARTGAPGEATGPYQGETSAARSTESAAPSTESGGPGDSGDRGAASEPAEFTESGAPAEPFDSSLAAASVSAPLAAAPVLPTGRLHHLEIWVANFAEARLSLGWMLERLGYERRDEWDSGASWHGALGYIVLESGPDVVPGRHERKRPGLNHLAFWAGPTSAVDDIVESAPSQGWTLMYPDRHPYAGGSGHYAAYMENADGFEVELVATTVVA